MELGLLQLSNYLVALANFASFPHSSKGLIRGSPEGVSLINFKPDESYYLNITGIGSDRVQDGIECGFACLEIPSCFSYNLAAFPDITDKLLCELLPSDKYNNSDKFATSPLFRHFSIPSPCSSSPCQNNGTCVSQYEKNSYVCICPKEYKGKYCQTAVKCTSNPCQNGGICNTLIDAYNCSCPSGFTGAHCEKGITINSSIISDNGFYLSHLAEFLAPAVGNPSHWLLCHRASTHGWDVSTFHSSCDGKNHTVTIIKNDQYVFGGYTDVPWVSGQVGYGSTSKAFIFSLRNKEGLGPFKSMVAVPTRAIRRRSEFGPTFGRGYDILIADNANANNDSYTDLDDPDEGNTYPAPQGTQDRKTILAGTFNFSPDDWEVFYLV